MATTTLLTGGTVQRMDGDPRMDEAIVVSDGRVKASGSAADMRSAAGADAEVIDLAGATVIPGLVDTHPHLMHFGALAEAPVDLSDATSHDEIVERLRARAAETPPGEWVMGTPVGEPHYFIRRSWRDLTEGALPGRDVLDRASQEHPIWIQAWAPVTPNVTAFNSAGLRQIGITADTPCSVGHVWIDKDAGGEPTGILRGSVNTYYNNEPFWDAILAELPLFTLEQAATGTIKAMGLYNALGVTTVYEGHVMGIDEINGYRMLRAGDLLTVRVLAAPDAEPYAFPWVPRLTDAEFEARLAEASAMADTSDDLLRIDGITISRGGPCWPGFMVMREPYRGPYGHLTTGIQFIPASKAVRAIEYCAEQGLRLNIVAVGDREHDEYLDQLERAAAKHDFSDAGWILQHAFFVEEGHARRYADLGFDITTSMSFSWGKGDLFAERVGEQVLPDLLPLRRLLDAGMNVSCGSDWGPKNLFEHMELACTHRFAGSGRTNRGPAQEVTREEAVAMWTREAAKVLRWEGVGTLAPGSHADLVVVDRDPLDLPP